MFAMPDDEFGHPLAMPNDAGPLLRLIRLPQHLVERFGARFAASMVRAAASIFFRRPKATSASRSW